MGRVIHWVWIGGPVPAQYQEYLDKWRDMNPDWDTQLWTEEMIRDEEWVNQAVVDDLYRRDDGRNSVELAVQVADVVDYEILYREGGVYLNVDIDPVMTLDQAYSIYRLKDRVWLAKEDPEFVVNAAMGAPAGHPFLGHVVERLAPRYFANPTDEMNQTTGPRLLTACYREWANEIVALPVFAFNPFHWSTIEQGGDATGREPPVGTIGIHHWGHRKDGRTNRIEAPSWR